MEVLEKRIERQCCSDAWRKAVKWVALREERMKDRKTVEFRRKMRVVAGVKKGFSFREGRFGGWMVILDRG